MAEKKEARVFPHHMITKCKCKYPRGIPNKQGQQKKEKKKAFHVKMFLTINNLLLKLYDDGCQADL